MWRRSFKKDWVLIFNAVFMAFFGVLGTIGLGAFSYAMLTQEHEARILPLAMAAGALIYLLIVFVWPSPENHLTPQKFATLPVTERQLFPGLTCAAFLQSRALLSIACSLIMAGFGVAGIQASAPPQSSLLSAFWVIACLAQGIVAVLLGEALGSLSSAMASRVWSERLGYAFSFLFLIAIMGLNFTTNGVQSLDNMLELGTLFSWTPFGAAAGAAASAIEGNVGASIAQGFIAAATILGCLWLWRTALRFELTHPIRSSSDQATKHTGGVMLRWASASPRGAVYSRTLRYWRRDVRYSYQAVVFILIGAMLLALGVLQGTGLQWYAPFIVAQGVLMVNGNDFGLDGPSNWVNMVSGVRPKDLIAGRLLASLTVIGPIFLVVVISLGAIEDCRPLWAGISVLAVCSLVQSLGLAPAFALRFPFPSATPGTSPMKNRSGTSSNAFILSIVGLLGLFIPLIPGAALLIIDLHDAGSWADATRLTAIGIGVQLLISGTIGLLGYRWAVKNTSQRWPKAFAKVRNWV
ncbi:ABC transporter permease [Corynebacterium sp.]|uniref:ABC transporter permease n=1 Tax=Corynebacterium sp. TaxID=1720 RepID=UPI00261AF9B4|nr:ABC transporter permease [Corynebacterium sp.]